MGMTFEFVAGNLALDLANTVHHHGFSDPQDDLKTYRDLIGWSRQAGLLRQRQRRQPERRKPAQQKADFERTQDLRESIYGIFSSIAQGKRAPPEAVWEFNLHLKEAMAEASLESVGKRFALTWDARGTAWRRVRGEITRAAVTLLTSGRLERVRQCAGETCSWLFLDTSRNGLRRWCDMKACGNRNKVQRFRKRKAAG
jgi:predicted RNA-binding Zn ribbon-like protein